MKRIVFILLAVSSSLILWPGQSYAQVSDAAVLFLRIAPGARSAGMGEAFTAIADDAQATHYNPAGLGEYPLANSWYSYQLSDDSRLVDLANQAFKGELAPDFAETFESWQVSGNQVSRKVNGQWQTGEEITIDPAQSVLASLSRRMSTADKDRFKEAVRRIAQLNTGVSFEQISDLRANMLRAAPQDKQAVARINTLVEEILANWQDLRINQDRFQEIKNEIGQAMSDSSISMTELANLENSSGSWAQEKRPDKIKVPYTILLTSWRGWQVPWEKNIRKIAVMENDIPTNGYQQFDIWALTNYGISRFNGKEWLDGDIIQPRRGDRLQDLVARALGTNDEDILASRTKIVAQANNKFSQEMIDSVAAELQAAVPEDYRSRTELTNNAKRLPDAWLGAKLDPDRTGRFLALFNQAMSDSTLTNTEADEVMFSLEKVFRDQLPGDLLFPFKAVFEGDIHDIAVDRKTLIVGTGAGLYRYNGRTWEKYRSGVDSVAVWDIAVVKRGEVWLATDRGVMAFRDGKWVTYGPAEGISSLPIKHIIVKNEKLAWAASDNDLYVYDGSKWSDNSTYTSTVNDSTLSVVSRFYGQIDQTTLELQEIRLKQEDPEFNTSPKAGVQFQLPFKPLFKGTITALALDGDNNLWVGTDMGLKRFDGKGWTSFGYKAIKVERRMSVEDLAKEYLKTGDPDKITAFVNIIKRKNTVPQGDLQPGRIIYVYANPAGSPIHALFNSGDRIYVASIYGTFSYNGSVFERYYHEDLYHTNTVDIVGRDGDMWLATNDKVVVAARGTRELSFTHANWLPDLAPDIYYEFLSYVQPFGSLGTLGASVTFLSYGTIPTTGETSSDITGEINPFDVAMALSYGTKATNKLSVGLSAKIIYSRLSVVGAGREVGQGSGTSFAVEGGLLYKATARLRLAAVLTNLGPNMSYIDAAQSDALPRNLALGFAYRLIDSPYNKLTIAGDINKLLASWNNDIGTELQEAVENVGMEYWYGSLLSLRAGYVYDKVGQIKTPTLGVGLQLKSKYRLDFAYIPSSSDSPLSNTLRTSLTLKI